MASLNDIHEIVTRIDQKLTDHMADPAIHTRPPCQYAKEVQRDVKTVVKVAWGVVITALLTLVGWVMK